eukprot:325756_1
MTMEIDGDLEEWMPATLNNDKAAQKQIRKAKAAQKQIIKMMYGGGDDENPLPQSVDLMENIITDFIQSFCIEAQHLADQNERPIRVEDFLFLIRKDIHKYKRVSELLGFNDFLKELRKDDYETIQNTHNIDNTRHKT